MTTPMSSLTRPTLLARDLDKNDRRLRQLLDAHHSDAGAVRSVLLARCWPDDAQRGDTVRIELLHGESLDEARVRLGLLWHPQWLIDSGCTASDAAGNSLPTSITPAAVAGRIQWTPHLPLPRVDDKSPADLPAALAKAGESKASKIRNDERKIRAGQVALAALWHAEATRHGLSVADIDTHLSTLSQSGSSARGARWNGAVAYYLELALEGWRVETQVSIRDVFGLHLRKDVVARKADAVVISPQGKVMAFVSAKFSWRSDRGTEAAQMVFLQRYRPDLPYVLLTAEFPRALTEITTESIEDRAFHLCGDWVGAWAITQELPDPGDALRTLRDLTEAGSSRVPADTLLGIDQMAAALRSAARYL
jgi:hypothetical protein